ncbi:MAG: nicotinate (nicotinamide) nucleotide adenylyltransferase [Anaerolineae bacterium]|nr:nicotinate (nicotinamide) nucleotide adenylyltransferase [Anaerolineales bacterium]MCQ3974885.1 nicotinate (nicotinamide) nucleotide adenylyltransferase [Anaerolineae bacterium]
MKLGFLGGTFDPIHLGHLLMAETAWEGLGLSQVLFVPAGDPPHKQGQAKTPAVHRVAMVERAIAGNPHFALSRVDLERPGPHYTTDTVRLIRAQYHLSAEACFLIIGGDSLVDLPTWHDAPELITLCRLAVIGRPGYRPDLTELEAAVPGLSARLDWVDMPPTGVSSRDIRARVRAGRSIRYQVTESVRAYIEQQRLYQTDSYFS